MDRDEHRLGFKIVTDVAKGNWIVVCLIKEARYSRHVSIDKHVESKFSEYYLTLQSNRIPINFAYLRHR